MSCVAAAARLDLKPDAHQHAVVLAPVKGRPATSATCSGANGGPWRQSDVLQKPRVQLLDGLNRTRTDLGADDAAAE
jgi:hypothetical protein